MFQDGEHARICLKVPGESKDVDPHAPVPPGESKDVDPHAPVSARNNQARPRLVIFCFFLYFTLASVACSHVRVAHGALRAVTSRLPLVSPTTWWPQNARRKEIFAMPCYALCARMHTLFAFSAGALSALRRPRTLPVKLRTGTILAWPQSILAGQARQTASP